MPEENEEKTLDTSKSKEAEEKESEESKEEEEKPSEEEEKKEPDKVPDIEPKKRFPDQTPEDKKLGYEFRQWKKKREEGKLDDLEDDLEDEENKPVTRREVEELVSQKDKEVKSELMLNEFLSENPDYRKYEKVIRKHLNDPAYSNIPIGFIASGIVGQNIDDEANERADLKRKADEEAEKTKSIGSSKRSSPGKKKSVWDMSKEEFEEEQQRVLRGEE